MSSTTSGRAGHPTMEDVARLAGVSRALVSLALRGSPRVSAASSERIAEAARQLGYRPNAVARQLASKGSATIGVLLNDLHNPFFAEIYDGLQHAAEALGYRLLLTTSRQRDAGEQVAIDIMLEHRVDGMVLTSPRLPSSAVTAAAAHTPVAVIGRRVNGKNVDSVMTDDSIGVGLAVQHLAHLGHRAIVHIDGGRGAGAVHRRAAYIRTMQDLDLGPPDVISGDFTEDSGGRGAETLLRRRHLPTAVLAANDLVALGAIATLEAAGHPVPSAISVIGYDNSFVAGLRHVSLTTIDQPRFEIGDLALRLVQERIVGERTTARHEALVPTLVTRRTTAVPRPQ